MHTNGFASHRIRAALGHWSRAEVPSDPVGGYSPRLHLRRPRRGRARDRHGALLRTAHSQETDLSRGRCRGHHGLLGRSQAATSRFPLPRGRGIDCASYIFRLQSRSVFLSARVAARLCSQRDTTGRRAQKMSSLAGFD